MIEKINNALWKYDTMNNTNWKDFYNSEIEIINDLKRIDKNLLKNYEGIYFIGYETIYYLSFVINKGWSLSRNQKINAKRLAKEIKKALTIQDILKNK